MSTWTFTISANFTAATQEEAFDAWVEWLINPRNIGDGTQVTENLPDDLAGTPFDKGLRHTHDRDDESARNCQACYGTEGQDRESYTDTQDRDEYTIALETPDERHIRLANEARAKSGLAPLTPEQAEAFLRSVRSFRRLAQS